VYRSPTHSTSGGRVTDIERGTQLSASHGWPEPVVAHLTAAGWYPGRAVDPSEWAALLLEHYELRIHDAAIRFLTEFGGLDVPKAGPQGVDVAPAAFTTYPRRGVLRRETLAALRPQVTGELYPIGDVSGGNSKLLVDEASTVYLIFASQLRRVGVGADAIANLVLGRRPGS